MANPTRDIPNTTRDAAAEGYNIGFESGPRPGAKSYWELNNDLIAEAYERIGALERNAETASRGDVQATIDAVASAGGGAVRLDPSQTYRTSEEGEIHVKQKVALLCHGVNYLVDRATDAFAVAASGKILGYLNVEIGQQTDYSGQRAIRLTPRASPEPYGYGDKGHNRTRIEANLFNPSGQQGTAIDLNGAVSWISFVRISGGVHNFKNGVRIDANNGDAFVNGNIFNLILNKCQFPIHTISGPMSNQFYGVIQCGQNTQHAIYNEEQQDENQTVWRGKVWDTFNMNTSVINGWNITIIGDENTAQTVTRDTDPTLDNQHSVAYGYGEASVMGNLNTGEVWQSKLRDGELRYEYATGQNSPLSFDTVFTLGRGGVLADVIGPVTSNHTAAHNEVVLADTSGGNVTVTLPAARSGLAVTTTNVQSASTNALTVETGDSASLNGQPSVTLSNQGDSREWVCDGAGWWAV